MNKLGTSSAGARGGRTATTGARAQAAPPVRDVAPNLDTGVLFIGDAAWPAAPPAPSRGDMRAPFTRLVGARIGPGNPAWGADALDLLRSLQRRLIGHALTLPASERRACLDAVAVIEPAVGMRLRIMQMQMAELEPSSHQPLREARHGA